MKKIIFFVTSLLSSALVIRANSNGSDCATRSDLSCIVLLIVLAAVMTIISCRQPEKKSQAVKEEAKKEEKTKS